MQYSDLCLLSAILHRHSGMVQILPLQQPMHQSRTHISRWSQMHGLWLSGWQLCLAMERRHSWQQQLSTSWDVRPEVRHGHDSVLQLCTDLTGCVLHIRA